MANDFQNRSAKIIAELGRLAQDANAAGRPGDSLRLQGFAAYVQSIENALSDRLVDSLEPANRYRTRRAP